MISDLTPSARDLITLGIALVVLTAVTAAVSWWAQIDQVRAISRATIRAVLQIVAVGAVLGVIFSHPQFAPLYLVVMVAAASWTSGRRLGGTRAAVFAAGAAIVAGAGTTSIVIVASRALDPTARDLVPLAAQLIGGAMTATSLAGQRMLDDVHSGWEEVEGWLAIGAQPVQAVREPARRAATRALVPAIDQTRNVGLVTLPGAFVGLLLAGATPLEAGRLQLLVLVGLLTAETIAAVVVTSMLSPTAGASRPELR